MSTAKPKLCPQCGAPFPTDAPKGLCPRCLVAENLLTDTAFAEWEAKVPAAPLQPDELAPHFPQLEILAYMGRGGMGVVYKARQKSLNRFVALKLLAPERVRDTEFGERFIREAQALAQLNHPNIVTVYDFGQASGFYFLLMEYVDGVNLRDLLQSRKLAPEEAVAIVPSICEALQYAHDQGVVHRDIKPENLLLDKHGRIKIADFGVAKILDRNVLSGGQPNEKSQIIGTPRYMAPEQANDPLAVDHRADIYALGVVFYEMLTGELPIGKFVPPSAKVEIDVRLDEIVLRALEAEPNRRYQQVSEIKTQVDLIAKNTPFEKNREPFARETEKRENNRTSKLALFTGFAIGLLILTAAFILAPLNNKSSNHQTQGTNGRGTNLSETVQGPDIRPGSVVDTLPPVVVSTMPVSGTYDVEPGEIEIKATFSKEMADGSWSWATAWQDSLPQIIEGPRFEADRRTCIIKVRVRPGETYACWLNSDKFQNFQDKDGRAAVPYLLIFQTKGTKAKASREEQWREDIDFLAARLPDSHKDFFQLISERQFATELEELRQASARESDSEMVLRLMRFFASLRIAHSGVNWQSGNYAFKSFPLRLSWYSDGLVVMAAAVQYQEMIGCRVSKIGAVTPEQLEGAIAPFISHENKAWLRQQSSSLMSVSEVLQHLKVTENDGSMRITCIGTDGKDFSRIVRLAEEGSQETMTAIWDRFETAQTFQRRKLQEIYWFEHLAKEKAIYIQYNRCAEGPDEPFGEFVQRAFSVLRSNRVERLIVDLRFNAGGNSLVIQSLIQELSKRTELQSAGRLLVLIGNRTFSSGMMAALDLRKAFGATLIGEPTGGKPNSYGEIQKWSLPNSKLEIFYPVKFFQRAHEGDPESLLPNVFVPTSSDDLLSGRDPVLQMALEYQPKLTRPSEL